MALKDWKKIRDKSNSIAWFNNKKDESVHVVKFINDNKWSILIDGKNKGNTKTKPQALKYARRYMKTH